MIRAGRETVDRFEVGELHGLSAAVAPRRRPWAQPGHPAPVNRPGGRKSGLWDREQAAAYAAGQPVPSLPEHDHPDDLFDAAEAAEFAGVEPVTWTRYVERGGLVPDADAVVCGQPHWRRRTLARWKPDRPGRGAGGGRRAKSGLSEEEMQRRATELVAAAAAEGRTISAREVGRAIDVSPTKASKLVAAARATPSDA